MRIRPKHVIVVLMVLMLIPLEARGDSGTVVRTTLAADRVLDADSPTQVLITLPARTLSQGQAIHLKGRLEATSSTTGNVEEQVHVGCLGGANGEARTSRNHEGKDQTSYAIDGHLPIVVNYLFVAPQTGSYACRLYGLANSSRAGEYLTALKTVTWIEASSLPQTGANQWEAKPCWSNGTEPTCVYLVPSTIVQSGTSYPSTHYIFYSDFSPRELFYPSSTATKVEVIGDAEVTTCYRSTGSCIDSVDKYGGSCCSGSAVVYSRLEVLQLNSSGQACGGVGAGTTYSPAPGTGDSPDGNFKKWTISDNAHHFKINTSVTATISTTLVCQRRFLVRIYLKAVSGNPVKLDGVDPNNPINVLTDGIAMNV